MATKYLRSKRNTPVFVSQSMVSWLHWSRPIRIYLAKKLVKLSDALLRLAVKLTPECIKLEG